MHIHQISIDNFKSFAEKTVIPFENGFTTISGPNGSGKSNIIDSILFCLGLSTSRTMRAEKLSDLINNLSKRKEAVVTITFRRDPGKEKGGNGGVGDEKEKHIVSPEETEGNPDSLEENHLIEDAVEVIPQNSSVSTPEEMLQVTRRIRETPSGYTSTYYMNDKTSTLTEIHERLEAFNISPGTYNVMMQGDVAGIVNMSPMERRKIIDEIAGVAEFDRKIEQAQRELEATGANIERNSILLSEIEVRLAQLGTERDHALKYKQLRDEKIRHEGLLLLVRYHELQQSIAATLQNITEAKQQKEKSIAAMQGLLVSISETQAQLRLLAQQVQRKGEDQQIALKKQIEGLKGHIARQEDVIRSAETKTKDNLQRMAHLTQEMQRMQDNTVSIESEIQAFEYQITELQALYQTEVKQNQELESQLDRLTGSTDELTVKRTELRQQLAIVEDSLSQARREKLDGEASLKRLIEERDRTLSHQLSFQTKNQELQSRQTTLKTEKQNLDEDKSAFEAQLRQLQVEHSQSRLSLNQAQEQYQVVQRSYMQLEARQKAYDEVNFTRSVETILRSGLSGVHGTVAQLGDVQGDYALAMEIALGGRLQNIVVDDEGVASDGIRLLQENRAGRATFLPLNKIQGNRRLPALPHDSCVIDYAVNLISFESRYEDIFSYALGDTLIVTNSDEARPLLRRYRMVTLDGSLLEKSGAMTGGSQPGGRGGAKGGFFSSNTGQQELQTLAKKLEEAEGDKARRQKQLTTLELKLETVQSDYRELLLIHSRISAELDSVLNQLKALQNETSTAQSEPEKNNTSEKDWQQTITKQEKAITDTERVIVAHEAQVAHFHAQLQALESQAPSEPIEALRQQIKEVKFQMDYYDTQTRNVQADIQSKRMEQNYQQVGRTDCQERFKQAEQQNLELEKEKAAAQEEISLTWLQINELQAQTKELDEELKKLQAERDSVQQSLLEQEKQKNIQERAVVQLEEQITALQAHQRNLTPQSQQLLKELQDAGLSPEQIQEAGSQNTGPNTGPNTDASPEAMESQAAIQQRLNSLTRRMESMEPVNMLAIEAFDATSERRNALAEKIETLTQEREALHVKIASFHELKRLAFMKAYEQIDQNFRTIFAELSDGSGELALTRPDSPFEGGLTIHAQPRGKKMLRIEGLSGGEKSLTSLAFVFALQRTMPAPFYALDEVDQNLDGINAEKLAQMVFRESHRAQFIVVSLRRPMIECSERTIGVTQRQNGITKVTGVKHRETPERAESLSS